MAFGKKKKVEVQKPVVEEIKNEEIKEEEKVLVDDSTADVEETKNEEIKTNEPEERKLSIKTGAKIIANGRCFGSENLECPLKSVRNYEAKIIEVSEKSVLIDEGWISKDNIK